MSTVGTAAVLAAVDKSAESHHGREKAAQGDDTFATILSGTGGAVGRVSAAPSTVDASHASSLHDSDIGDTATPRDGHTPPSAGAELPSDVVIAEAAATVGGVANVQSLRGSSGIAAARSDETAHESSPTTPLAAKPTKTSVAPSYHPRSQRTTAATAATSQPPAVGTPSLMTTLSGQSISPTGGLVTTPLIAPPSLPVIDPDAKVRTADAVRIDGATPDATASPRDPISTSTGSPDLPANDRVTASTRTLETHDADGTAATDTPSSPVATAAVTSMLSSSGAHAPLKTDEPPRSTGTGGVALSLEGAAVAQPAVAPTPSVTAAAHIAGVPRSPSGLPGVASQLTTMIAPIRPVPAGGHTVTIALQPEGLGTVRATMTATNEQLVVRLSTTTPDADVAVRAALPELHTALSSPHQQATVTMTDSNGSGGSSTNTPGSTADDGAAGPSEQGSSPAGPTPTVSVASPTSSTTPSTSSTGLDVRM